VLADFMAALGACMLLSSAFLGVLLAPCNRQDLFWSRTDTVVLFAVIFMGAILLDGVHWVLARWTKGRCAAICAHGIYVMLAFAIVQLIPQNILVRLGLPEDATYIVILGVGAVCATVSAVKRERRLVAVLWRSLRGLALLFPILFFHLLRFPSFVAHNDLAQVATLPAETANASVVIYIFDSISMAQCVDANDAWRADLPAMAELRSDAVCFDSAVSCGVGTAMSMPNLLFQRSPADYRSNSWEDSWFAVDPSSYTNGMFYIAKQRGYRTGMLGHYLPFGQMLASLLDGACDVPFTRYWAPDSLRHRFANQLVCLATYARGPFEGSALAGIPRLRYIPGRLAEEYFLQVTRQVETLVRDFLSTMPGRGHLLVSFMGIPHSPAIFLADGTADSMRATYDTQLRYTDKVLGTFLETMKATGSYDSSWIILTSDHGHHGFDLTPE